MTIAFGPLVPGLCCNENWKLQVNVMLCWFALCHAPGYGLWPMAGRTRATRKLEVFVIETRKPEPMGLDPATTATTVSISTATVYVMAIAIRCTIRVVFVLWYVRVGGLILGGLRVGT